MISTVVTDKGLPDSELQYEDFERLYDAIGTGTCMRCGLIKKLFIFSVKSTPLFKIYDKKDRWKCVSGLKSKVIEGALRSTFLEYNEPLLGAIKITKSSESFSEWKYGKIVVLSEKEKINLNRSRGRKKQYKPCAICGCNGGELRYRKTSDGNPCLICGSCAISYVVSAIRLSHDQGFNRGK